MLAEHALDAACLHREALRDDFLPGLGEKFLYRFYQCALRSTGVFGFVDIEPSGVRGFVFGCEDTTSFFRTIILHSYSALMPTLFQVLLCRPKLWGRALETLLYPAKESTHSINSELLVIAVEKTNQGRGIGSELVLALGKEFLRRKVRAYKVTVHQDNKAACLFHERLGFMKAGGFRLYSRDWIVYTKTLA